MAAPAMLALPLRPIAAPDQTLDAKREARLQALKREGWQPQAGWLNTPLKEIDR